MIQSIRLQNYRSYTDSSFEVDPSVNIVVGPNASGKTNLLESIIVACYGKSFRGSDSELIRHGSEWSRIDMHVNDQQRTVKIQGEPGRGQKEFIVDDVSFQRLSLQKQIHFVLFEPNDLRLLHAGPEFRRAYLDTLLERLIPVYAKLNRDYKRALYQRNTLLKKGNPSPDNVFVWDVRLSELGGKVARHRQEAVQAMQPQLKEAYKAISGASTGLAIAYSTRCQQDDYSTSMFNLLKGSLEQDVQRGYTSYGPHRDDIVISIDDYPAKDVASRGETRTIVLALKTIEMQLLTDKNGKKPILLLDDVFSELDGARRRHLTDFLTGHQVFITTTDADIVLKQFMDNVYVIPLKN